MRSLWLATLLCWAPVASAETSWTNHFAVRIRGGEEVARSVADKYGFSFITRLFPEDDFYHFQHPEVPAREKKKADVHLERIVNDHRAFWVEQQSLRRRHKRSDSGCAAVRPSDRPCQHAASEDDVTFNDPCFPQQWYLRSCWLNVVSAWRLGWTGRGVTLSVLDDGLMHSNADISPNYDAAVSCSLADLDEADPDPTPDTTSPDNGHGTYCAAIMAAAADNHYCGVGVAYQARVGGVRLLERPVTDLQEATALVHGLLEVDVYSASWGPRDDGGQVDGPGELARAALRTGVSRGRNGKGAIYVWAVGNGGLRHDNCNLDGYASSIFTVSINALTQTGHGCFYDEPCSSTLASTYVGGHRLQPSGEQPPGSSYVVQNTAPGARKVSQVRCYRQVVPELDGRCRDSFQGTSAAAPLAAGMIALMLQANPRLSWRDVQHIVARTARSAGDEAGWRVNAAGLRYHPLQGFGALDALRLVEAAAGWHGVTPGPRADTVAAALPLSVVAQDSRAVDVFMDASPGLGTEHAVACVTLQHRHRGQLELFLVSPAGTVSQLLTQRKFDNSTSGFAAWNFTSVHFWGEAPRGMWQLILTNHSKQTAVLKYFQLTLYVYKVNDT
ncbi:furin-like protease 1 [Bacillus rossius redtenbacheri]|uniref:furin-like protease 1 n=1 Tax=Bacillus rossius redtenbacheri TaxID=93214 RepID=UPI002FDD98DE